MPLGDVMGLLRKYEVVLIHLRGCLLVSLPFMSSLVFARHRQVIEVRFGERRVLLYGYTNGRL